MNSSPVHYKWKPAWETWSDSRCGLAAGNNTSIVSDITCRMCLKLLKLDQKKEMKSVKSTD